MPVGWVTYVTAIEGSDVNKAWTSDWGVPAETVHRPPEEKPSTPPEEPSTPPEEPSTPPAPPEQPENPEAPEKPESPPVEPVAETPETPASPAAPAPSGELPRTGTTGNGMLIGLGIVLVGLGSTILLISGSRRETD